MKFCAPLKSLSQFRVFSEEFCRYGIEIICDRSSFPSCMSRVRFPSPAPILSFKSLSRFCSRFCRLRSAFDPLLFPGEAVSMGRTRPRPILRWHGGKWKLAPWILSHFSEHRIYVEPYGGAASVLLRKPRSYAEVYNDLDGEVVNLFRVLRQEPEPLIAALRLTPFAREEFEQAYQKCDDPAERARRLVIRSFMGFGSNGHARVTGFRANSNRSGTTPAHDWANYPDALAIAVERLRGVVIESRDALEVMAQHDGARTLHYVDPPYVLSSRSDPSKDYAHEMTDADHAKMAEVLHGLTGMVVLSGYHSPLYDDLFRDWQRVDAAALADGARPRREVLWFNAAAWAARPTGQAGLNLEARAA